MSPPEARPCIQVLLWPSRLSPSSRSGCGRPCTSGPHTARPEPEASPASHSSCDSTPRPHGRLSDSSIFLLSWEGDSSTACKKTPRSSHPDTPHGTASLRPTAQRFPHAGARGHPECQQQSHSTCSLCWSCCGSPDTSGFPLLLYLSRRSGISDPGR